jgi:dGTPase
LVEAISLGHDLGHTPFGHVGEEVLNELCPQGFRHSEQSLRIVESLEKDGRGLNLTWEVREGILKHSKTRQDVQDFIFETPGTLEAQICRLADIVAYINHDIGDAIRAGLVKESELPELAIAALGKQNSARINTMVCDIISQSWTATGLVDCETPMIAMSPELLNVVNNLRRFLFQNVYDVQTARAESERAKEILRCLYQLFIDSPEKLPGEYARSDDVERRVVDYIAGMTDNYALRLAEEQGILASTS